MRHERAVALSLAEWLERTLAPVDRCPDDDPCPDCREGLPCPRDVWSSALAPVAIVLTETAIVSYWSVRGQKSNQAGRGKGSGRGYIAAARVSRSLADAILRLCRRFWLEAGEPGIAGQLVEQAWRAGGSRDPQIAEARVVALAAAGRSADLIAAIREARTVLRSRAGSTDPAWVSLAARSAQLEGKLARLTRPTVRRHHPSNPKRPPRAPRFLRMS